MTSTMTIDDLSDAGASIPESDYEAVYKRTGISFTCHRKTTDGMLVGTLRDSAPYLRVSSPSQLNILGDVMQDFPEWLDAQAQAMKRMQSREGKRNHPSMQNTLRPPLRLHHTPGWRLRRCSDENGSPYTTVFESKCPVAFLLFRIDVYDDSDDFDKVRGFFEPLGFGASTARVTEMRHMAGRALDYRAWLLDCADALDSVRKEYLPSGFDDMNNGDD
ncbi:MAG: hypothetical protein IIT36_01140 [Aeriscardovia sp.]|nr:hypothetical protein [Aeriscardovia sp.]